MNEYTGRIDTQEEINQIQYQPFFEKKKKTYAFETQNVEEEEVDVILPEGKEDVSLGDNLLGEALENLLETESLQKEVEKNYEEALKNIAIPTPSFLKESIGESITSELYKAHLLSFETQLDQWVVDIWEKEAEDMQGNLYMELYGDVIEVGQEIQLLKKFSRNHLWRFYNIQSPWKEEGFTEIKEKEKAWQKEKESEQVKKEAGVLAHRKKLLTENKKKWEESFREREKQGSRFHEMEKKESTLLKDLDYVQEKTFICERTLSELNFAPLQKTYDEKETMALELLLLGESEEEVKRNLTNISALLKVSLDEQNKEKAGKKAELRTLYHPRNQEKIQSEYFLHKEAYFQMGLPVLTKAKSIHGPIGEGVHEWMDAAVKGLLVVEEKQQSYQEDVYNTSFSSHARRDEKIRDVRNKHKGRETYWLANQFKKEIEEKGLPTVNTYESYLNEGEI